ncbi:head-to-tail adaptor [Mycobacterium phage Cornie]|uniref:Head-to-tail adaptor n=1 Tax=Mycobacterium phage Cornie TaxID=2704043 RepID=A0A6G6XK30_9CAUD|nr:head-to-tail adaptor [Mycobacterium phage Cornie]QIG58386.1 head-to-tail adaptor [Mycobacterium phage Cornie]
MTTPVPQGKFVTTGEAVARFEGDFPTNRVDWLAWRIFDVENALMGLVPSLRKQVESIFEDSVAAGDEGRLDRVRSLVVDKVLSIYRNPGGVYQQSQTVDDVVESRSYYRNASTATISFTDDELAQVRLRGRRRPKLGSIPVDPWRITW